jgi:hypothetical protein
MCGLLWWYINGLKDTANDAVIPGLKILILMFAAILILIDAFMFFETDRLVIAASASVNGSCISYTGSSIIYPSSIATTDGVYLAGDVSSLNFEDDGDIYSVIEAPAIPPATLYVNYTNATDFQKLHFKGMDDNVSMDYSVAFLRTIDGVWVTIYSFSGSGAMIENHITMNGSTYLNDTNVSVRVTSATSGSLTNRLMLDWLVLDSSTSYTAYCPDGTDTEYIFIYHNMETSMMVVLLSILPYLAIGIFGFVALQTIMLIHHYATKNKGESK